MAEPERKRLKKKVLERWENEGGRLCDVPPITAGADTPSPRQGQTCDDDLATANGVIDRSGEPAE